MAKAIIQTLEDVPEALREEYVEQDGVYVLKLEGDHPATTAAQKAAEAKFRQRNIDQAKALDEAKTKLESYTGVDPAEYTMLKKRVSDFEQQLGAKDPAGVLALVQRQVAEALAPVQEDLRKERETRVARDQALARKNVESALRDAATKAGVDDPAIPDFLHRGLQVFQFEEDRVIAKGPDGAPLFSKAKPGHEMSPEEWAFGLASEAPHLFRESRGGGSPGGSGGSGGGGGRDSKWVDGTSPMEIGKNLEDIASGKVRVTQR